MTTSGVALLLVLLAACLGQDAGRRVSEYEIDPPYMADPKFWDRPDLYVMRPDLEPKDRWPAQVLRPSDHGIRILVLLPGDYRARSTGAAPGSR